jgi:hypothetical protein
MHSCVRKLAKRTFGRPRREETAAQAVRLERVAEERLVESVEPVKKKIQRETRKPTCEQSHSEKRCSDADVKKKRKNKQWGLRASIRQTVLSKM